MARFVEFQTESNTPVCINPNHVINVEPDPDNADQSLIRLSDGAAVTVAGALSEVVHELAGAD
jgi:hypothetical protein